MQKVAILVDGGYYKACFKQKFRQHPSPENIINHCEEIISSPVLNNREMLRIYYYDCLPYDGKYKNPFSGQYEDYSETHQHKENMEFINHLISKPYVAFRKGILQLNGWKIQEHTLEDIIRRNRKVTRQDIREDFQQKRIDMNVGMDIAWLAGKGLVDAMVLITGDTDFVPALKFARREGLKVVINILTRDCSPYLKEHSDYILKLKPLIKR